MEFNFPMLNYCSSVLHILVSFPCLLYKWVSGRAYYSGIADMQGVSDAIVNQIRTREKIF